MMFHNIRLRMWAVGRKAAVPTLNVGFRRGAAELYLGSEGRLKPLPVDNQTGSFREKRRRRFCLVNVCGIGGCASAIYGVLQVGRRWRSAGRWLVGEGGMTEVSFGAPKIGDHGIDLRRAVRANELARNVYNLTETQDAENILWHCK